MVVMLFALACTLASAAYGIIAYIDVSRVRNENYALQQEEYAARERCDKLAREVEYVHARLATVRDKYLCIQDEVVDLRTEMANIHASLKTNLTKRRLKEWQALAKELTC